MAFRVEETTIADIHAAYRSGDLSTAELVSRYLARIEAYDRNGPALNSVINVNPRAMEEAEALDEAFAKGGLTGPLHGIPVIVKDQIETADIVTTFGSAAAAGYLPEKDATIIRLMREAGAIILAKTAMPDFATSWFGYCSAIGATKNPYDLERDPGGSSGGTGCAVAANLSAIGLGEDTGGSARLPASFDNLVGLKVTPGLISRAGMSPLVVFQDSAGPMCRTVTDTAKLLQVIVGFDSEDPYTSTALIAGKTDYVACLEEDALSGKTIGVVAFGLRRLVQSRRGGGQRGHRGCPWRTEGRGCHPRRRRNPRLHGIHRVLVALHQSLAECDRRVHGVPSLVAAGKHPRPLRRQAVPSGARSVRRNRAGSGRPLFGSGILSALHDRGKVQTGRNQSDGQGRRRRAGLSDDPGAVAGGARISTPGSGRRSSFPPTP